MRSSRIAALHLPVQFLDLFCSTYIIHNERLKLPVIFKNIQASYGIIGENSKCVNLIIYNQINNLIINNQIIIFLLLILSYIILSDFIFSYLRREAGAPEGNTQNIQLSFSNICILCRATHTHRHTHRVPVNPSMHSVSVSLDCMRICFHRRRESYETLCFPALTQCWQMWLKYSESHQTVVSLWEADVQ